MKKTNKSTKQILSIILALGIVLSFALSSVSAVPADFTIDGTMETHDFEAGNTLNGATNYVDRGTMEVSGDKVHSTGSSTLKITAGADGYAKFFLTPSMGLAENSKYYLSFWYYSDAWGGSTTASTANIAFNFSAKTKGQWNKVWAEIDMANVKKEWTGGIAVTFWSLGNGNSVYVDDIEIAKVNDFSKKVNEVPVGATVAKSVTRGMEDDTHAGIVNAYNGVFSGVTIDYAHYGEKSLAYVCNGAVSNEFFVQADNTLGEKLSASKTYYLSYYVYSPDADITTAFKVEGGGYTSDTTVKAGVWTKATGVIQGIDNVNLLRVRVVGGGTGTLYFDDFVFAEISEITAANATLTTDDVDYNYDNNTAVLTCTSNVELKTAAVTPPEDVTVESAVVDGTKLTITLSGLTPETDYALEVEVNDIFGRTTSDIPTVFTTPLAALAPMKISASSIANGATDVLAPVDYLYITTQYPVNESTLTLDKFSITGIFASVTAVTLVDGKIKVELDGIFADETYTLSVDGVENTSGGVLKDAITFTTKAAENGYSLSFENLEADEETGEVIVPVQIGGVVSGGGTRVISNEQCYNNSGNSLKVTAAGSYPKLEFLNMPKGKTYKVSFYWYSANWAGNTNLTSYGTILNVAHSATTANQWNRTDIVFAATDANGMALCLNGMKADNVIYIDDIKVSEIGAIANPVMLNDGAVVNTIKAGTTEIAIPVSGDATAIKAFVVQYDTNGMMLRAAQGTSGENVINIKLENGDEVKTKIILMDSESFAPVINYIQYN